MSSISDHLSWRETLDILDGIAATETQLAHLGSCRQCEQTHAEAETMEESMRFLEDSRPSPALIQRIVGRLEHYGPELAGHVTWATEEAQRLSTSGSADSDSRNSSWLERVSSEVKSLVSAALVADSWNDRAIAVRGTNTASPRILVYETAEYTVSLSLFPGPDPARLELDLVGHVAPRRGTQIPADAVARLLMTTGDEIEAAVQSFGEFRFEGITARPSRLALTLGPESIEVESFPDLGAS